MLEDPEEYVRVVLEHLMMCRGKHGDAHVRIGITGTGRFPSHKIVYMAPDGTEVLFGAWAERTPFTETIHEHTWSRARMSVNEVRSLLGEMRGFRPVVSRKA